MFSHSMFVNMNILYGGVDCGQLFMLFILFCLLPQNVGVIHTSLEVSH